MEYCEGEAVQQTVLQLYRTVLYFETATACTASSTAVFLCHVEGWNGQKGCTIHVCFLARCLPSASLCLLAWPPLLISHHYTLPLLTHCGLALPLPAGRDLHSALGVTAAGGTHRLFSWHRRGRRVALELVKAINYLHSKVAAGLDRSCVGGARVALLTTWLVVLTVRVSAKHGSITVLCWPAGWLPPFRVSGWRMLSPLSSVCPLIRLLFPLLHLPQGIVHMDIKSSNVRPPSCCCCCRCCLSCAARCPACLPSLCRSLPAACVLDSVPHWDPSAVPLSHQQACLVQVFCLVCCCDVTSTLLC